MFVSCLSRYCCHVKVVQLSATVNARVKQYAQPARRTLAFSHCSTTMSSVKAISRQRNITKLRQPRLPFHTIMYYPTPLTVARLPSYYAVARRCHIRYYSSHHRTLAPMPENAKTPVKRLPRDKCKIEFFHSRHDFRDYNERNREYTDATEDMDDSYHNGIFTVHFHSTAIAKTAVEYYNNNSNLVRQQLEYYAKDSKRWKKFPFSSLNSDPEIQYYKGKGSRPIPLRVKSEYEEDDSSDDDNSPPNKNGKLIAIGEDKPKVIEILYILQVISQRFARLEFRRTDEDKYKISSKFINMGESISITDWLMDQAAMDDELSGIILRRPGALQHLVTCFAEFDELWNHEKDPFVDEEDEMEKYRERTKPDIRKTGKKKKTKEKRERDKQKILKRKTRYEDPMEDTTYFG